ncbi:Superfamily I DNA and RNA helicases and helicase subunits-like protein [Rubrobacter xylanophilus DSM 9941]|uniref:Superfamily I DNA and RNA helicases and helicase subunits-like protein n=1 Tax=Rubrobacter xylanophilus (strain DSM 9941 / JCM 11954 / NBRC 16129 / PRD-1) TaxID=266117 RepID=Q1AV29_RUBXD|nr:AAA domain-containing protein [Rubrobacter xylanophilus]ABG04749.1 Superfamily I DNA and RNA helicases and helicase subunits-like protein [Rubrobacter xylanophilus DSM 9941]
MPLLAKKAISQYFRTGCRRQLRLNLSPDTQRFRPEREAQGMPPRQRPRPGLEQIARLGEEWQAAKLRDLAETFGEGAVVGEACTNSAGQRRYRSLPLEGALSGARPGRFLVEAEYAVGPAFESALGITSLRGRYGLEYAGVRPDIIQVLPPGCFSRSVDPSGETRALGAGDTRPQLRVIDVKLTAEPSPGYFAEVAYYTMALAGWLADRGLDHRFVAVPEGAVWPGSHNASRLVVAHREMGGGGPDGARLREALEQDLEPVPFEVFAQRLRRFFREELPQVLSTPWRELPWHVDNRCKGCDYLGYPWVSGGERTDHPDHCMPEAEREGHLSRVAFVSRGAGAALRERGVKDVEALAARSPEDPVFGAHHVLKATRTVVSGRAEALKTGVAAIPKDSGTSAVMPRWTDLRVFLSADFDVGSAITLSFGLKAFWIEPRPFGSHDTAPRRHRRWGAESFVVDLRDLEAERRELMAFLERIATILEEACELDGRSTVQFYLWDSLQLEHLSRVVGRHLGAILDREGLWHLAWLFPPEELLQNPALSTRQSPITTVRDVVRSVLAVPVPHYYSLLETARRYHPQSLPENLRRFDVHPLFEDALSDQIPSERAHEIWSRSTSPRHWSTQIGTLRRTVAQRLTALEAVVRRLEGDLRPRLPNQAAPRIQAIRPPQTPPRLSFDGQLWYAFARLDAGLQQLEVQELRALPPHAREAKFECARLPERLLGSDEVRALAALGLRPRPGRRVYRLSPDSREVKFKEGDFELALAPEGWPDFLDRSLKSVTEGTPLEEACASEYQRRMGEVTKVAVAGIDRDRGLIALDPRPLPGCPRLEDLEEAGIAGFDSDVVLDRVYTDYFTRKLRDALQAIGNPPAARDDPLVRRALGRIRARGARATAHTPPADFLWGARTMHETRVGRELGPVRRALEGAGLGLNPTQWRAWEEALTRRLSLIWGPPGTGKSRTARAVILGAVLEAHQQKKPIRVLVCAQNYNAMDVVLLGVYEQLKALLPEDDFRLYRVRSHTRPRDTGVPEEIDTGLDRSRPTERLVGLSERLEARRGITVVGATPNQVHNLLKVSCGEARGELFDLILIDEASQMDVALSILALCSLAKGGSVVLAGDPKQLPPIRQADPPLGLEAMVGSVYAFCADCHGVEPVMLDVNYRSNATLVGFSLEAGYEPTLRSHSPDLRLNLLEPLPKERPEGWPASLCWTPEWAALLDSDHPAACFVYPEGRSSQWNRFEADTVAALITLLYGRAAGLSGERDPATGRPLPVRGRPYSPEEFWKRAVGVVTPHRAQQGLIVSRLRKVFPEVEPELIRGAVDTVERFQGQERDVILASYALGDPDAIADEDEFLMSENRFNVMASRPRAKLVVFVSREVVDHLPEDLDVLRGSRLLKVFVDSFCREERPAVLGFLEGGARRTVPGTLRRRGG